MATSILPAPEGAAHQGQCSAGTARGMRTPTGDYMTCAGDHAVGDPHGAGFGNSGWFAWTDEADHQDPFLKDGLAQQPSSCVSPSAEVRHAVARFRSASITVARFAARDSADMTPDEHNTWYDKLTVMRDARAIIEAAGQLHLVMP
ncbi:hypothetical protein [Streptomyces sp. NPDC004230]